MFGWKLVEVQIKEDKMPTYKNVDGMLEVTPDPSPVKAQKFTLEQIEDMIANTEADKSKHLEEIEKCNNALVKLNALKAKAVEVGVEPVAVNPIAEI